MLITMFSFMGAEIVTIAAAESDTPEKTYCPRRQLGYLAYLYFLFVFYFCRCGINPVEYAGLKAVGSYRSVYQELLNIPHAKLIMDCVILLSVTSCLNSALYTASGDALPKPSR